MKTLFAMWLMLLGAAVHGKSLGTAAETGPSYFGHRYYDAVTGQWLTREPLGEDESLNLYSYCHNDPVNHVDVLGLAELSVDAPSTEQIENSISILLDGIKRNEEWIYRKKDFKEWIASWIDSSDELINGLNRDKQEVKFLKTIIEIRNALGKDDYGTYKQWHETRKHFGDNSPESVVSYYLKPSDGLLMPPSYREFSRIQDTCRQIGRRSFRVFSSNASGVWVWQWSEILGSCSFS